MPGVIAARATQTFPCDRDKGGHVVMAI